MRRSVKTAAILCALIMAATSVSAVTAYAEGGDGRTGSLRLLVTGFA